MTDALTISARQRLGQMLSETGHTLTVDDMPDVIRLNALCAEIAEPTEAEERMLAFPVRVGNVTLHPLTIGVSMWMEERVLSWFAPQPFYADATLAYALTLSRLPESLWEIESAGACRRTVKRWLRAVGCSYEELMQAVTKVLPPPQEGRGEKDKAAGYGAVVALLCREYGSTPHVWMWDTPATTATALVQDFVRRNDAEQEAAYRAASKGGGSNPVPCPYTRKVRLMEQSRDLCREMIDRWQKT